MCACMYIVYVYVCAYVYYVYVCVCACVCMVFSCKHYTNQVRKHLYYSITFAHTQFTLAPQKSVSFEVLQTN